MSTFTAAKEKASRTAKVQRKGLLERTHAVERRWQRERTVPRLWLYLITGRWSISAGYFCEINSRAPVSLKKIYRRNSIFFWKSIYIYTIYDARCIISKMSHVTFWVLVRAFEFLLRTKSFAHTLRGFEWRHEWHYSRFWNHKMIVWRFRKSPVTKSVNIFMKNMSYKNIVLFFNII